MTGLKKLLFVKSVSSKSEKIQVVWNQLAYKPFDADHYEPWSANTTLTFDNGVATQVWLSRGGGFNYSINPKSPYKLAAEANHYYYVTYMCKPDFSGGKFGIEWLNKNVASSIDAFAINEWGRFSAISQSATDNTSYFMIANLRNSGDTDVQANSKCEVKSLAIVDLTMMYGVGNEPTLEEFEQQCTKNGIDLTSDLQRDAGTQRLWIV